MKTNNKFATLDDINASTKKGNNKEEDPDPKSTKDLVQEAFNKDKVDTEKDEASNVAILNSVSKRSNSMDKMENNMADSR